MQTDTWLTEEATYPEQCPLCSRPLKNGSTTCYACGFTTNPPEGSSVWIDPAVYEYPPPSLEGEPSQDKQPIEGRYLGILPQPKRQRNPLTPIPARASAQPVNAAPGSVVMPNRVGKGQKNSTAGKTKQQQDPIHSGAESSTPVNTQRTSPVWQYESSNFQAESSLPALSLLVSETPTQPEVEAGAKTTRRLPRVDEIDTAPPQPSRMLIPVTSQSNVAALSGPGRTSIDSQQTSDPVSWTAGAASQSSYAQLISARGKRKKGQHGISLNPLDRVRWWLLRPGRIEFVLWLGGTILLVSVTCALLLVTAFSFDWLGPRSAGITSSSISGTATQARQATTAVSTAHRTGSQKSKQVPVPVSNGTQNTPVPTTPPGVRPTATPTITATQPTAAGSTPVSSPTPGSTPTVTPTPGTTPTVTPTPGTTPTVTPTPGTTPTVTPTAGTTPTVTPTAPAAGATPGATPPAAGGSTLGNDLMQSGIPPVDTRLGSINLLVWLVVACYTLSMMLLGLAGVLHKRHR
jgi:hypothetical protein